jgi:hypothetical protein
MGPRIVVMLAAATLAAQTNRGRLAGTVLDQTGAAVPGAAVTVTNQATNESFKLATSSACRCPRGSSRCPTGWDPPVKFYS